MSEALIAPEPDHFDQIAQDLSNQGWSVIDNFLDPTHVEQLEHDCRAQWEQGEFQLAGVGHGHGHTIDAEIRSDRINWLNTNDATPAQKRYFQQMETLRLRLNQYALLGLFDFEFMQAVYPPGSRYKRHRDQFRGIGQRTVTVISYLNPQWLDGDGGQLRFYPDTSDDSIYMDIEPRGGRLVVFMSADFEHEVLPARRERLSITGWFKKRAEHSFL